MDRCAACGGGGRGEHLLAGPGWVEKIVASFRDCGHMLAVKTPFAGEGGSGRTGSLGRGWAQPCVTRQKSSRVSDRREQASRSGGGGQADGRAGGQRSIKQQYFY